MLSDPYGQGVQYPSLDDKPNARTLAENLVTGIVPKSVMQFDSRSQRGATLTSPVAGMQSWIRDLKLMELFDGANWVTMAAGTNNWTTITLASGFTHNENDQGDAQYRIVSLFGQPTIMFRGSFKKTSFPSTPASNYRITGSPLPITSIINTKRTVLIPVSDTASTRISLKMDVETGGHLSVWGFGPKDKPAWMGLNGVFVSL